MTAPYYTDEQVTVLGGDCRTVMGTLAGESVDAVVCDPPYGLDFMGKHWDTGAVAFDVATWRECLRLLKPGGHLLAFGGTRTWHRLAAAIEDAGFEIRDSIAWLYGSGFPKSLNLPGGLGTALKPAHEPIVVARKPIRGTVAANVVERGTGALNIDACRVPADEKTARPPLSTNKHEGYQRPWNNDAVARARVEASREVAHDKRDNIGRWPTNVVIDEGTAQLIDKDSGVLKSGDGCFRRQQHQTTSMAGTLGILGREEVSYGDSGGASRFFPTFKYQAKADTAQRPTANGVAHPTVKPLDLMRWLVRLVTPPAGLVLDPFAGSGTTAEACIHQHMRCIAIEREPDYLPLIVARLSKPMAVGFDFEGETA